MGRKQNDKKVREQNKALGLSGPSETTHKAKSSVAKTETVSKPKREEKVFDKFKRPSMKPCGNGDPSFVKTGYRMTLRCSDAAESVFLKYSSSFTGISRDDGILILRQIYRLIFEKGEKFIPDFEVPLKVFSAVVDQFFKSHISREVEVFSTKDSEEVMKKASRFNSAEPSQYQRNVVVWNEYRLDIKKLVIANGGKKSWSDWKSVPIVKPPKAEKRVAMKLTWANGQVETVIIKERSYQLIRTWIHMWEVQDRQKPDPISKRTAKLNIKYPGWQRSALRTYKRDVENRMKTDSNRQGKKGKTDISSMGARGEITGTDDFSNLWSSSRMEAKPEKEAEFPFFFMLLLYVIAAIVWMSIRKGLFAVGFLKPGADHEWEHMRKWREKKEGKMTGGMDRQPRRRVLNNRGVGARVVGDPRPHPRAVAAAGGNDRIREINLANGDGGAGGGNGGNGGDNNGNNGDEPVDPNEARYRQLNIQGNDSIWLTVKRLNTVTLFEYGELDVAYVGRSNRNYYSVDCLGTPYCGYVCIDVAVGLDTSERGKYEAMARPRPGRPPEPLKIGKPECLGKYAKSLGYNLQIFERDEIGERLTRIQYRCVRSFFESPQWKTIFLEFVESERVGDRRIGHYRLITRSEATQNSFIDKVVDNFECVEEVLPITFNRFLITACFASLFYLTADSFYQRILAWAIMFTNFIEVSKVTRYWNFTTLVPPNDDDVRSVVDRRDPRKFNDHYHQIRITEWTEIPVFGRFGRNELGDVIISGVRFVHAHLEMQSLYAKGLDTSMGISSIFHMREVNSDVTIDNLFSNTAFILREYVKAKPFDGPVNVVPAKLVAYNSNSNDPVINSLDIIARNQNDGMEGGLCNHVPVWEYVKPVNNIPVAVSPIGNFMTADGILGPGLIGTTDSPGLLSAFCVRSMKTNNFDPIDLDRFVTWSMKFLDDIIDNTDVTGMVELKPEEAFREEYQGKKSKSYIDSVLEQFELFKVGRHKKKFLANSAFVKLENNAKIDDDGVIRDKKRLIMTMSDQMLVECCQILKIIHRWNEGPFSLYQIKSMTPEEMIKKVCEITGKPHMVTDYSSFECSINDKVRNIERYVMKRLCMKAGFYETWRAIQKHSTGLQTLKTKYGHFKISTRRSGDFWTSFGNGLVNVCLAAYCSRILGVDLEIIAEGDDGLVPKGNVDSVILERVGFKFSQSCEGSKPGDVDFLRSRWIDGKRYLNIGRTIMSMWLKSCVKLKRSKQLYILRCVGNSIYHLSPGHPVLTALVNRINGVTSGMNAFKNYARYLNSWNRDYTEYHLYRVEVDESMREYIAAGAIGFPPISIADQIELEQRFERGVFYLGRVLDSYEEINIGVKTNYILDGTPENIGSITDLLFVLSENGGHISGLEVLESESDGEPL